MYAQGQEGPTNEKPVGGLEISFAPVGVVKLVLHG